MSRSSAVWRRARGIGWTRKGANVYLTPPGRAEPFTVISISGTGTAIWDLIDGRRTVEEIVQNVVLEWGAEEGDVSAAVEAFTATLEARGILERSPA